MEMPELLHRIYTLGEEPPAVHSISYHTCWTLHAALKKAFHDDEYEELKESKLGVFIKFQELGFDWASRLVHYMLGFQLDIKKKYELWSLVGPEPVRFSLLEFENLTGLNCEYIEDLERPHSVVTKELTSFWEMLGVHVEAGPSTQEIIAALERCEGWSRDDRKRLATSLPRVSLLLVIHGSNSLSFYSCVVPGPVLVLFVQLLRIRYTTSPLRPCKHLRMNHTEESIHVQCVHPNTTLVLSVFRSIQKTVEFRFVMLVCMV
ncbi:hypothetical protein DY000_02052075 [Brassica cretica]|uniref:DUF1985 domain-containing protein n=1 Tax=Brassica cretica TaxID=69181 RepID=A0ABQ7AIW2_BRACR|nr:hypothetical protein DY000_02052075 [Brassica cretica]